jgi:cell division septation protein DedD
LELLVKERLTGAIILVVLIVLLVPELLSGPKGPAAKPPAAGAASPSSEEPPLRSYTINLGDEHSQSATANGAGSSSGPPQPQVNGPETSGPAQPTTQAATPEGDLTSSSTWDTAAAADSRVAGTARGSPNSGPSAATSDQPSSARDKQPLRSPASQAPTVASSQKPAAGAKANQSAPSVPTLRAKASQNARAEGAQKAPLEPRSGSSAASESGGWGVQLGVFASRENAERLALEVRVKGFKASVSGVTSGKRKLYRVRVGPAADRSAAQELQAKLKAAGRPGGTVVPYS